MSGKKRRWVLWGCLIVLGVLALLWIAVGIGNLVWNPMSMTAQHEEEGRELGHVRHEFADEVWSKVHVFDGACLGPGEDGLQHAAFAGVLEGEGRILDVGFPDTLLENAVVRESGGEVQGGSSAWLVTRMYCCVEMETVYALLDLEPGAEVDPADVLSEHFGYDAGPVAYPAVVCDLDMTNTMNQSTRCWLWRDGPVVTSAGGSVVQPYDWDVEWVERDRAALGKRRIGMLGTAILDVVTGPLQLAFWLLLGPHIVV